MNSDDDGAPDDNETLGTIIIDGTLNVANDVYILTSDPESALNGEGTINVSGNFTDQEGGDFENCALTQHTSASISIVLFTSR